MKLPAIGKKRNKFYRLQCAKSQNIKGNKSVKLFPDLDGMLSAPPEIPNKPIESL